VVKVIWHKTASPPQTDGSVVFSTWIQCTLPSAHIGATWRIRLKLCALFSSSEYDWNRASFGPPESTTHTANRSVQPFVHSSLQNVPILYNERRFPPKLRFLVKDLDPDLIHDSLGHSQITIQTAWRSIPPFSHRWPQSVHVLHYGNLFPQNCPFPLGDRIPHLTHDSLGQFEPISQTASRSVLLFLHRWPQHVPILYNGMFLFPQLSLLMGDLDPHLIHGSLGQSKSSTQTAFRSVQPFSQGSLVWQTDRPRYSVGNNRPHTLCSKKLDHQTHGDNFVKS